MTTRQTKARTDILGDLLQLLVQKWGYSAVSRRLSELQNDESTRTPDKKDESRHHRLSALEYVEKIDLPSHKRDILREIAKKFEDREFLPTVGHVKDFFERTNVHVEPLKARSAAVRKLVDVLVDMPDDNLETILRDGHYSGPSSLAPLSDAIKSRGNLMRSSK